MIRSLHSFSQILREVERERGREKEKQVLREEELGEERRGQRFEEQT